jgi:hypothetical protein
MKDPALSQSRRSLHPALITAAILVVLAACLLAAMRLPAETRAGGADVMRKIFGERAVAVLETVLFKIDDLSANFQYQLGMVKSVSPWESAKLTSLQPPLLTLNAINEAGLASITPFPQITPTPLNQKTRDQKDSPTPTVTPTWAPAAVTPLGSLPGAGVWQPYLHDAAGEIVAYRTFIQPDEIRPYALTGVVAINLARVHLHYVIGWGDPYARGVAKKSTGLIPKKDLIPVFLLAGFNGGFKFEHGGFGSRADDFTSVPPKDGLGTIAIYQDGRVRMGAWNMDFSTSADMTDYRQNGPLVIQDQKITDLVDDPTLWGEVISGGTVTWRSGLAMSQDMRTLYYFAGPFLSIQTLAKAMAAVNPQDAMQLDINPSWVLFTAFRPSGGKLVSDPLFPKDMNRNRNRYLGPNVRDFFYIVLAPQT